MSKKRSEIRKLKATIEQQMEAAAQEIFRLLQVRGQAELPELRELLTQRLSVAAEVILNTFETNRAGSRGVQEPGDSLGTEPAAERRGQCELPVATTSPVCGRTQGV